MRGSEMTKVRLPISFSLSLCTGVAVFGLLHFLIAVDRSGVMIDTVPDVVFCPVARVIVCPARPHIEPNPVLEKPKLPPEPPPITIERDFYFYEWSDEPVEFDSGLWQALS